MLERNIYSDHFGDRKFNVANIEGIMPMKESYDDVMPEYLLKGKMAVFTNGLVFEDKRLHLFVGLWHQIEKVIFHMSGEFWLEIIFSDTSSTPLNSVNDG